MNITSSVAIVLVLAATASACSPASGGTADVAASGAAAAERGPSADDPSTTTAPAPEAGPTTVAAPPPTAAPTTAPPPPPRFVYVQEWAPMAQVGEVVLLHPSSHVERVGFHESNHDGARQMEPLASAAAPMTLESRERGTGSRTAADVVVHPDGEIRAPVTGTVKRAGSYVLYCDNRDDFVVIEPDVRPGYEVKVLHISGVQVRPGDRVVAGQTVLAPRPTQLPFESQVDEHTSHPAWPHTHIEVVDISIPDKPNPGGGGGCP